MIGRFIVLAAAVTAIALLAGQLRTARDIERAIALVDGGRAPERVDEALALLSRAATRTDATTPLVRAAELQLFTGRPGGALADARAAVRREPDNARAWLLTAQAAGRVGDETLEAAARRRLVQLVARP